MDNRKVSILKVIIKETRLFGFLRYSIVIICKFRVRPPSDPNTQCGKSVSRNYNDGLLSVVSSK